MSKLMDLLGRKKPKVEIPAYVTSDNSQLHRRMNSILSRPTRKDLNPPQLTRDDYAHAGYSEPAIPEVMTDETAWKQDVAQDQARAVRPETDMAATAPDHDHNTVSAAQVAEAQVSNPDVLGGGKPFPVEAAAQVADHADAEGASSDAADNELEKLRERLKARLEALTGETLDVHEAADDEDRTDIEFEPRQPEEHPIVGVGASMVSHGESGTLAHTRETVFAPPLMPETDGLLIAHEEPIDRARGSSDMEQTHRPGAADDEALQPLMPDMAGDVPTIPRIPLPASVAQTRDGEQAAALAVKVADYLMFEAGYYPEELPSVAVSVWCMDYLVRNLSEGGLGAFVYNAWGQPDLWTACTEGLKACGAEAHLNALEALSDLVARDAHLAEALGESPDAGQGNAELAGIEDELAQAEQEAPLLDRAGRWLLDQDAVEYVDDDAFQDAVTSLGELPALEQRRQAAA
ncbi:hypothetical protein ACLB6G_17265 [Zhengella sp. ZM62]|uniref:DMP19 family protein n=1 Tax=Zhengella sedimenti TaxID=3390035 RepID=UPI0039754FFA